VTYGGVWWRMVAYGGVWWRMVAYGGAADQFSGMGEI
jgi:hypothetical protein